MPQNLQTRREREKELYGSPPFTERPSISANSSVVIDPDASDPEAKYFPLDKMKVANKSNVGVEIWLDTNPSRVLYVEANTQEIFEEILPFRSYKVVNTDPSGGTDLNEGDVVVTARKSPLDADKAAQRQAAKGEKGLGIGDIAGLANLLG